MLFRLSRQDDLARVLRLLWAADPGEGVEPASAGGGPADAAASDAAAEAPAPETDLDAIIDKALSHMDEGDAAGTSEKEGAALAESAGRKRGADGRFTPSADDAPGDAGSAQPAKTVAAQPGVQPAPQAQSLAAPDNWSEPHKAEFAKLPLEGQKFLLDRHGEMQADYTRKTQEVAEFRKSAEPLVQATSPFAKYVESLGRTMPDALKVLLGTEYALRTGPPELKAKVLAQLAIDYNIPLAAAHQLITGGQVSKPVPLNPATHQLIQQTQQRLDRMEQADHTRETANQERIAAAEIETFRNTKTADGLSKYPQYERVRDAMSDWLGSEPKELDGKTLPQMLETAYARFGAPIDEAVKTDRIERQQKAGEANAAAVAKAKNAAPVRSNGSSPRGSATSRDLSAIIDGAMAKVGYSG